MQYGMSKKPTSYVDVLKQKEQTQQQVKPKFNLFNFSSVKTPQPTQTPQMNFGQPVSQRNVTNFSDYKQTIPQTQTQPTQKSGFSLIPTANADYITELEYDIKNGATSDEIIKSYPEIKGNKKLVDELMFDIQNGATIDEVKSTYPELGQSQPEQEPQVTEQSFGEMGLNIAGNIYKGVENLGADAINIGSSAIGSDFRVKPLRDQLFDNTEEYKGGLSQDIANKIYKRGEKMANISENSINQTQGETSFQFGANLGAGVTDTIGEVFFSGLSTLTPDSQKEKLNNYIQEIAKTEGGEMAINKAKELKTKYQEFKFNNPRAGRNTDAVLDTLNFITNSGVIKLGDKAINTGINKTINTFNKGVSKVGEGIDNILKKPDVSDIDIKTIDKIREGVRPSNIGVDTTGKYKMQEEKLLKGVKEVVNEGYTPKNAKEAMEAISETKQKIWGKVQEANKKVNKTTNGNELADDIYNFTNDIDNDDLFRANPELEAELIKYAEGVRGNKRFESLTQDNLQQLLTQTNSKIPSNSFLKQLDSNPLQTQKNTVLSSILRDKIENNLMETLGITSQDLRNSYGAVRQLEKDLAKRYGVYARQNPKGLLDFFGIEAIPDIAMGIITGNVGQVAKGVIQKGIISKIKNINNPNNIIRDIFEMQKKVKGKQTSIKQVTPQPQKPLLQLQPGKKEPIITPQTLDNAVIQQSKADLQKAKINTTTPQPKSLFKQKEPLKKEPTTSEKVVSDTTQAKENKPLLKKENLKDNGLVKKDIEGYTQSLINKRGEYLEISKRYQNILKEIENEKNTIKLKELKKQEKIIGKELNDFADNSNYKSYENKLKEKESKITNLSKENLKDNGLVKKENYDEVWKSMPKKAFNSSYSDMFKTRKEYGILDYKKIGTDYYYYDVKNGWKTFQHNGHKFIEDSFNPTQKIKILEDQLKELEGGLNDKGVYNTREKYNEVKEKLDFFKKYEYNIYHNLDKDIEYYIKDITEYKDNKNVLEIAENQFTEKLVRDYKITNQTHIAKVKEVIQKYIKDYGEDIKNYLSLLADDIVDIVGGRAKLLGGEKAKLFDKSRWEQAKEMSRVGKSADEIWEKTGWEKGTDGKWKFEIDDSMASLKKGFDKDKYGDYINVNDFSKPLKDILEHKELFIQYPNLKKVEVRLSKNLDEMGGASFDFKNNIIYLDDRLSNKDKLKYLIHEIQHGIQKKEGNKFDYGNREIDKTDYEVEARNSETRLNRTPDGRKLLRPEKTEDVLRESQIVKMEGGKTILLPTNSKQISDDLISEAKKYKTFEEFKKAQGEELYHGTNSVNIEGINKKGFISGTEKPTRINGIWFSYNKNTAKNYGDTVITSFGKTKNTINTNSKEFEKISKLKGSLTENILNKGYDAVIDGENIAIINPKNIKTEAQLKTIYEQATKPKLLKKAN